MIIPQRIGKSWYLVRPAELPAASHFDKQSHRIAPIVNSFWTGDRWTFVPEKGKAFQSQREAGTYLSRERVDMV
jgi:hypothetical protein